MKDFENFKKESAIEAAMRDFEDHRKKIRKPMTEKARELTLKRVFNLSGGDVTKAVELFERAIMNGWQGIY